MSPFRLLYLICRAFQRYAGRVCLAFCLWNWIAIPVFGSWGITLDAVVLKYEYNDPSIHPHFSTYVRGIYFHRNGVAIAGPMWSRMTCAAGSWRPVPRLTRVMERGTTFHPPRISQRAHYEPQSFTFSRLGFAYDHYRPSVGIEVRGAAIPWWFLTAVFALEPLRPRLRRVAIGFWSRIRPILTRIAERFGHKRPQRNLGMCRHCGYDLRATPARCPECGNVPATVVSPIGTGVVPT
jgi:hypothetical protein